MNVQSTVIIESTVDSRFESLFHPRFPGLTCHRSLFVIPEGDLRFQAKGRNLLWSFRL
jgi:hypothetical protein